MTRTQLEPHTHHPAGPTNAFAKTAQPPAVCLRDGEVVIYRRTRSLLYQCRYKLADGAWHRQTTGRASLELAIARACDIYDEARYRQRLGLAHQAQSFAQLAQLVLAELRQQIDAGTGKTAYHSYVSCIERYFLPYFGERRLEQLTHTDIQEFELWRNRQMLRKPKTSTLNNFTSAWNKIIATAVHRGLISERVPVPKLTTKGLKGTTRPDFSEGEINQLLAFMPEWSLQGRLAVEREMRPLLRDYVEMLLLTGMRHGTEALGISWRHLEGTRTKVSGTYGYGWTAKQAGVGSLPNTGLWKCSNGYTYGSGTSVNCRLKRHLLSVFPTSCSDSVMAAISRLA